MSAGWISAGWWDPDIPVFIRRHVELAFTLNTKQRTSSYLVCPAGSAADVYGVVKGHLGATRTDTRHQHDGVIAHARTVDHVFYIGAFPVTSGAYATLLWPCSEAQAAAIRSKVSVVLDDVSL